jgi:antitoxin (DNA-binding transcriptional repressor) of toxin-antitoxin stability system
VIDGRDCFGPRRQDALSQLLDRVEAREVITIARGRTPAAKLVPIAQRPNGNSAQCAEKIKIGPEFFEPSPDDELDFLIFARLGRQRRPAPAQKRAPIKAENPTIAADLLNDRVLPFFEAHDARLCRVLTNLGT